MTSLWGVTRACDLSSLPTAYRQLTFCKSIFRDSSGIIIIKTKVEIFILTGNVQRESRQKSFNPLVKKETWLNKSELHTVLRVPVAIFFFHFTFSTGFLSLWKMYCYRWWSELCVTYRHVTSIDVVRLWVTIYLLQQNTRMVIC